MKAIGGMIVLLVVAAWCATAQADGAADKTAREASKVTFDVKDATLNEVVAKLADLSGNKPFRVDEKLQDKTVTLAVKGVMYWEAVTKVAEQLGLVYAPTQMVLGAQPADAKLQFLEAEHDAKLTGYAGPAVVKVKSLSEIVPLYSAKGVPRAMGDPDGFNLGLQYFWEDRLEPLSEEIELSKVQPDKGPSMLPADPAARRQAGAGGFAMMGAKPAPCRTCNFNLPMPSQDAKAIAAVAGVVRIEYGTGEQDYEIEDALHNAGKEFKVGDYTIKVVKADVANGFINIRVEVKLKGEPVDSIPVYWTSGSYGWFVKTGDDGKRTRGNVIGGGGGGVRTLMVGGGAWAPQRVGGNPALVPAAPKKGEQTVMFQGVEAGDVTLVLTLPKVHETKEYPFTIKDIPLP